jgi:hypothetical protein
MAQYNDLSVLDGLTKRVYGKGVHQAVPDNVKIFFDLFPFVPNQERLGNLFVEAINLSIEQGVTRASGTAGVVAMNNSIASVVKQATVDAAAIIMQATLSWDVVAKARSANSAQSFESSMTQVVDNVLLSHRRHQTADMLYGGDNWGVISSGTASATQTITNASCAPALWYGSTNMLVDIYDPTLATKRNASPLSVSSYSVDPTGSSRTITFGASVTTTTNDVIVPSGCVSSQALITPPGLSIIAGQTGGTLFGLSQTTYPVFQATTFDAGSAALTMAKIDQATILPLVRGYSGRMKLLTHPRTFSNIAMEEVARIQLINGAVEGSAKVGFDTIRFTTAAGAAVECQPSPWIKEGEAYIVPMDGSLKRIGAVDIQLGGPADPQPTWRRIEGSTGYSLPTYSLQALFTPEPWKVVKIKNIVNT